MIKIYAFYALCITGVMGYLLVFGSLLAIQLVRNSLLDDHAEDSQNLIQNICKKLLGPHPMPGPLSKWI